MSPRYTLAPYTNSGAAITKVRKMLQEEDPRFRNLDRLLARAYIELRKQKIQQKKAGVFTPRMDLCDDPRSPYLTAILEVPGTKADHLSVRIENGRLIIEGERLGPHLHHPTPITAPTPTHASYGNTTAAAQPSEPNSDATSESALYPVRELKYGKFRREISLPAGIIASHVSSTLIEGMLTISWPRDPSSLGGHLATEAHTQQQQTYAGPHGIPQTGASG